MRNLDYKLMGDKSERIWMEENEDINIPKYIRMGEGEEKPKEAEEPEHVQDDAKKPQGATDKY